jgi:hypothetical protein
MPGRGDRRRVQATSLVVGMFALAAVQAGALLRLVHLHRELDRYGESYSFDVFFAIGWTVTKLRMHMIGTGLLAACGLSFLFVRNRRFRQAMVILGVPLVLSVVDFTIWGMRNIVSDALVTNVGLWALPGLAGALTGLVCPLAADLFGVLGPTSETLSGRERWGLLLLSVVVLAWTVLFVLACVRVGLLFLD